LNGVDVDVEDATKLCSLTQLCHLSLVSSGKMNDAAVACLANCKNIASIDFTGTLIEGTTLSKLPDTITSLNFAYCSRLADDALIGLATKHKLKKLSLRSTQVTGETFDLLPDSLEE